jgi:DNA helicase II / ATP-dependent DNA helicase PcrA
MNELPAPDFHNDSHSTELTRTTDYQATESAPVTGEYRIFGPPGTGKTSYLKRQIDHAATRFGNERVMVTSFTKAAAAEIASRDLNISREQVGTLHSFCYRALGGNIKIAEAHVEEWNRDPQVSHFRLTPTDEQKGYDDIGGPSGGASGDIVLMSINRKRALNLQPKDFAGALPSIEREFWDYWLQYKKAHHLLDFCDLLEIALRDIHIAPGNPAVLFADEAQDLTPLQLALIRQWGRHTEYFILAGDDDQLIYPHLGCIPEAMLEPELDASHIKILHRSYRVPKAIEHFATSWISRVQRRQEKQYLPRDVMGGVFESGSLSLRCLDQLGRILDGALFKNETVMILTTCNQYLFPVVKWLRDRGYPFHNPFRYKNGSWNPLSRRPGSAASRLLSLTAAHRQRDGRYWQQQELRQFVEWMKVEGNLLRGAKQLVAASFDGAPVSGRFLQRVFTESALHDLAGAFEGGMFDLVLWWQKRLLEDQCRRTEYPARVLLSQGVEALTKRPQIIVGTIHSVKGGEIDHVVLFPDYSLPAERERLATGSDGLLRVFYVGATRARQTLILAQPNSNLAVSWNPVYYGRPHPPAQSNGLIRASEIT